MTIDRAIEILNPEHREHYESIDPVNEACRMGMEALERTRWIPCSERLPEDFQDVLIWDNIDKTLFTGHYAECDGWTVDGYNVDRFTFDITHWQPLPEPPRKEDFYAAD